MKLFGKEFREEWIKLLVFTLLMTGISIAQCLFWPTINKMLPKVIKAIPDVFRGLFENVISEGFPFFIITQQFMKNIGMFGGFLAVLVAASAVARELENGTMEFLLAQPISRIRVLTEKYFLNLAFLAVPVILSTLVLYPAALSINESVDLGHLFLASIYAFTILAIVYSFTFCVGVFIDNQMHVISGGLFFVLVMGICVFFDATKYLSIYAWLDRDYLGPVLNTGLLPWHMIAIFIVINAALFGVAFLRFRRINI